VGNGVIAEDHSPHEPKHLLHWYYHIQEIKKYESALASSGIMSIPNFMKIGPAIAINCIQMDNTGDDSTGIWHMYRWSWVIVSSSSHITGGTDCRKLKSKSLG
jgi:hypothetical protein